MNAALLFEFVTGAPYRTVHCSSVSPIRAFAWTTVKALRITTIRDLSIQRLSQSNDLHQARLRSLKLSILSEKLLIFRFEIGYLALVIRNLFRLLMVCL